MEARQKSLPKGQGPRAKAERLKGNGRRKASEGMQTPDSPHPLLSYSRRGRPSRASVTPKRQKSLEYSTAENKLRLKRFPSDSTRDHQRWLSMRSIGSCVPTRGGQPARRTRRPHRSRTCVRRGCGRRRPTKRMVRSCRRFPRRWGGASSPAGSLAQGRGAPSADRP